MNYKAVTGTGNQHLHYRYQIFSNENDALAYYWIWRDIHISAVPKMEWNFLSYVGAGFLGYYSLTFFLQVIHGIRAFVLPAIGIKKNLKKLGDWAG